MAIFRQAWARLAAFFRKQSLDRELDQELAAHIDLAIEDYRRRGLSLEEARRRALIEFGGIEVAKERHREARGLLLLDGIMQDMRFATRTLRRSPGFTAIAVSILAVGIGVNAAVFTVTKAALFTGFPMVERNDRLIYLSNSRGCCVSYPDFEDWRAQAKSFEGMAIVHGARRILSDRTGFSESYDVTEVSADTFKLVGQKPLLGRDFSLSDEIPGAPAVAILSHDFWIRRFGADPQIIGRAVRINGAPNTIIGVMQRGFSFPQKLDLWVPLTKLPETMQRENRGQWFVFGRLTPGATVASVRAEMDIIGRRLGIAYPATNRGRNLLPLVQTFREFFILRNETPVYWMMWAAVGFVLLIACANLANLMLARAITRRREICVRIALGAGRRRIVRQLLVESFVLSTLGGCLGWFLAKLAVRAYQFADRGPGRSSWRILDYTMDYRVLCYFVAISLGTALLFGLIPALQLSKLDLDTALKDGGRGATGGERRKRLSSLLVIGEMALAVMLLVGAGLMIRSFFNIYNANLGVDTSGILTLSFSLPQAKYPEAESRASFYDRVKKKLEAIPGVESVAISRGLPGSGAGRLSYEFPGSSEMDDEKRPTVWEMTVGPGYFETLGAAVFAGREFNDFDRSASEPVVIVNERFAAEHWPQQSALGKRLREFRKNLPGPWLTVVGVTSNILQDHTQLEIRPMVYLPYRQRPAADSDAWQSAEVMARTRVPPKSLGVAFRSAMQILDSDLPIFGPLTLQERLEANYWSPGLDGVLFLIFAAIALLIASIGLYAVIAHSVSQRTQEIGIRMAMGATGRDIFELVFAQGMLPLGLGLGIGLVGSLAVRRVLESQLIQVSSGDPLVYVLASAVLVGAGALGCWLPARRAIRVDPVDALRHG